MFTKRNPTTAAAVADPTKNLEAHEVGRVAIYVTAAAMPIFASLLVKCFLLPYVAQIPYTTKYSSYQQN